MTKFEVKTMIFGSIGALGYAIAMFVTFLNMAGL